MLKRNKIKLNHNLAMVIRREWRENPRPSSDKMAQKYKVSVSTIDSVIKGKTWKDTSAKAA